MCRRIAIGCSTVLLLGMAALGLLFWDVTRREPRSGGAGSRQAETTPTPAAGEPAAGASRGKPPSPPSPRFLSPQERRKAAERTARRLAEQIQAPAEPQPTPEKRRFELRISEEEANTMLEDLPSVREQLDKANISEPRLRFRDDRLTASVRVPMYGEIAARVSLVGRVRPDNGGLAFETESVSFGSLPAPGPVREALDTQVRAALQRFNREFKGRVDEVIATEGTLILRGEKPS